MRKIYTLVLLSTSLILQTKSQNVGVGTATPASKLEIKGGGTTSATSALNVTNSGATSLLFVRDDGNVGIGNTGPSEKLHVSGNVRLGGGYSLNSEGDHLKLMNGVRADDNSYEWIGFYSGSTRQGIILYDGAWSGANSLTNEFSISAENGNMLTLNTQANNHIALMPKGTGNVGVGTTSPGQKLHLNGNFKMDGVSVEGSTSYRVYRNLASYSSGSGATGAFVIVTAQPWNSTCMFRVKIEGYFYDGTAPFELTVGGYIYNTNTFYNYGYINNGSKVLTVRLGRNIATNTVAIILGDEAGSYSYPKLSVTSFMQGHASISESYASGWSISQQTSLSGITDYMVTVPDVTKLNGFGSGDFIQNQFASAQSSSNFWISGTGRIPILDINNANTRITQGSGNSMRLTTNSGYTEFGPQNSGWSHFYTDRPRYYFNKGITVDEGLIGSYDEDLQLQTSGTTRITALNSNGNVGIGITGPTQRLDVQGGNARINNTFIGDVGHGSSWAGFSNSSSNTTTGYALLQNTDGAYTLINKQNTGSGYIGFRVANSDVAVITNSGNMGIGTTGPGYKLHVLGDVYANGGWFRVSGNQGLYWESWGGGFYMSDGTWIRGYNNRSLWMGSGLIGGDGGLTIGYGGASPPTNGAIIKANVGINMSSPSIPLDVFGAGIFGNNTACGPRLNVGWYFGCEPNVTPITANYGYVGGASYYFYEMYSRYYNAANGYYYFSDRSIKENIRPIESALEKVMKLNGVVYDIRKGSHLFDDKNPDSNYGRIGFVAQDFQKVLPNAVREIETQENSKTGGENNEGKGTKLLTVEYTMAVPVLVEAIKEQQMLIEKLENRIKALENNSK
jgi:hypothetical protein